MLKEISSPVFKEKNVVRPAIIFKSGLNVILGMENAANSIGKSSMMLAIDFVFGGNTYLKSDAIKQVGEHTIYFCFEFDQPYYYARPTNTAETIFVCDSNYTLTGISKTKVEYIEWLKEMYNLDFHALSFRETLSTFFRIYGKDNCDEKRPLQPHRGANLEKSIMVLVYLYNKGLDIEKIKKLLDEEKEKLSTFKNARKYSFVSNLVGGKEKFEENRILIKELEIELLNLRDGNFNESDIQNNKIQADLKAEKLNLETRVEQCKRREKLISISLEYGLYPTEADLNSLQEYFPEVNIKKLYEVENYHKKLASILDTEFTEEKNLIDNEIKTIQSRIDAVNIKIKELGIVGNFSKEFLKETHHNSVFKIFLTKLSNKKSKKPDIFVA